MAKKKQRRIFLMKDIPNFCLKKFNVNSVPSTLLVSWSTHFDYYCVSPFLAWGDFHARSRFARSTVPEEKWGTTRGLVMKKRVKK